MDYHLFDFWIIYEVCLKWFCEKILLHHSLLYWLIKNWNNFFIDYMLVKELYKKDFLFFSHNILLGILPSYIGITISALRIKRLSLSKL